MAQYDWGPWARAFGRSLASVDIIEQAEQTRLWGEYLRFAKIVLPGIHPEASKPRSILSRVYWAIYEVVRAFVNPCSMIVHKHASRDL